MTTTRTDVVEFAVSNAPISTPQAFFTGRYVNELKDLYVASMISGLHSVSIGAPGWGKTDVALSMLLDIFGEGNFGLVRTHPATAPEEIEGANDTEILLKESRLVKNVTGTPYDPRNKAVLIDEIGRCSKVLVGPLMFLLDRKDVKNPPPILSTSNFMPSSVEAEALLDRIALWHHIAINPKTLNPAKVVSAQLSGLGGRLHVNGSLPTNQDIEEVWDAVPGPHAIKAVGEALEQLSADASAEDKNPHPRRLTQWSRLLYRMSVYETSNSDFISVPQSAREYLRFAWPAKSSAEHENWVGVVKAAGDPLGALIEDVYDESAAKFNELAGLPDDVRGQKIGEFGVFVSTQGSKLRNFGDDPRLREAERELQGWFSAAIKGEKVDRA